MLLASDVIGIETKHGARAGRLYGLPSTRLDPSAFSALKKDLMGDAQGPNMDLSAMRSLLGELAASENDAGDPISEWLEVIGRGFRWMTQGVPEGMSRIDRLRALHAHRRFFGRRLSQSPFLPEHVVFLTHHLTEMMGPKKHWAVLDDDHFLALAMAEAGHKVTLFSSDPWVTQVTKKENAGLNVIPIKDRDPIPDEQMGSFDAVFFDSLHYDNTLFIGILRACALVKMNGAVVVTGHPNWRPHHEKIGELAPLEEAHRNFEMLYRYHPLYVAGDILWDLWIYRRQSGDFLVEPNQKMKMGMMRDFDPSHHIHGSGALENLEPQGWDGSSVECAIDDFCQESGVGILDRSKVERESASHHFLALKRGGHIALTANRTLCSVEFDITPWRPRLHIQIGTALMMNLPRIGFELDFSI